MRERAKESVWRVMSSGLREDRPLLPWLAIVVMGWRMRIAVGQGKVA